MRESAKMAVVRMALALAVAGLSGCDHDGDGDSVPVVDLVQIAADVDAQIAARQGREAAVLENPDFKNPGTIAFLVEFIEVPKRLVSDFTMGNPIRENAADFRRQAQIWMKSGQAELHEMLLVNTRSGQLSKVESVRKIIYPSSFGTSAKTAEAAAPEGGKSEGTEKSEEKEKTPLIPPHPIDFETRNIGSTLEIEPIIESNGMIRVTVKSELSFRLEQNSWQIRENEKAAEVETPTFQSTELTTEVVVKNGGYAFLGTGILPENQRTAGFKDSILLIFLRADSF